MVPDYTARIGRAIPHLYILLGRCRVDTAVTGQTVAAKPIQALFLPPSANQGLDRMPATRGTCRRGWRRAGRDECLARVCNDLCRPNVPQAGIDLTSRCQCSVVRIPAARSDFQNIPTSAPPAALHSTLDRTQPILPITPGLLKRRTRDHN